LPVHRALTSEHDNLAEEIPAAQIQSPISAVHQVSTDANPGRSPTFERNRACLVDILLQTTPADRFQDLLAIPDVDRAIDMAADLYAKTSMSVWGMSIVRSIRVHPVLVSSDFK
jgi:hypothetical protein